MNDKNPVRFITVSGVEFPVIFNTNAAYTLEMYLQREGLGTVGDLIKRLLDARAGMLEVVQLMWACLEGGRVERGTRQHPFTIQETNVMIDQLGGLPVVAIMKVMLLDAVKVAAPKPTPEGSNGAGPKIPDPNVKTKSVTGRRSSNKRSK